MIEILVHAAATLAMTGLIWFVQVVHYPLFVAVGRTGWKAYARAHQRRTTLVVLLPMLTEALTVVLLLVQRTDPLERTLVAVGAGLLVVIWASTAFLQVPCHRLLEREYDAQVMRRLVRTNWLRTAAWTARAGLALALVHVATA